jgi:hypothetical protein
MNNKTWQGSCDLTNEIGELEMAAPLSGTDLRAFIKLATSDWSMAAADVACLLERDVIAKTGRAFGINQDNRVVLGLTV